MTDVMEAMPGFTFGCDPELFVTNPDGEFVTADGLIPGTKSEPFEVDDGAVQVDGMAAEFNTKPAKTYEEFNKNVKSVLDDLKKMLPTGYKLHAIPSVVFSEKEWERANDKSKELGCTPDFNAWTGEVNSPPDQSKYPRLRTASGHLHLGWTDDALMSDLQHITNCRDLVKQLDWFLGGWSLQVDRAKERRILYGKAGACRYKPYGVEYRVLSNFWLKGEGLRLQVWNRMQKAIWEMKTGFIPNNDFGFGQKLISSINGSERNTALESYFQFPLQTLSDDYKRVEKPRRGKKSMFGDTYETVPVNNFEYVPLTPQYQPSPPIQVPSLQQQADQFWVQQANLGATIPAPPLPPQPAHTLTTDELENFFTTTATATNPFAEDNF